jgi:hypothetical protein
VHPIKVTTVETTMMLCSLIGKLASLNASLRLKDSTARGQQVEKEQFLLYRKRKAGFHNMRPERAHALYVAALAPWSSWPTTTLSPMPPSSGQR